MVNSYAVHLDCDDADMGHDWRITPHQNVFGGGNGCERDRCSNVVYHVVVGGVDGDVGDGAICSCRTAGPYNKIEGELKEVGDKFVCNGSVGVNPTEDWNDTASMWGCVGVNEDCSSAATLTTYVGLIPIVLCVLVSL